MTSATGSRGFTLLELLVTLCIVLLLVGVAPVAVPRMFPRQQLRSEIQEFAAMTRMARSRARLTGQTQSIRLEESQDGYGLGADVHRLANGMRIHARGPAPNSMQQSIPFNADGSSTPAVVEFELSGKSERIRIGAVTGRSEILP